MSNDVLGVVAASSGASSGGGGGGSLVSFLPLLLIVLIGYLLLVRPARARQRRAHEMRSNVAVGAEVTTTAGLIATVVAMDDETVTLEVAPGVHSRYVKGAVARVNTPVEPQPDAPGGPEQEQIPAEHPDPDPDTTER